jgi:hypothetical protein
MQAYVFSSTLRQADCPDVTVSDNPGSTVRTLKAGSGKDIWLWLRRSSELTQVCS